MYHMWGQTIPCIYNSVSKKVLELVKIGVNFSQFEPISTSINKGIQLKKRTDWDRIIKSFTQFKFS